MSHYRVTFSEHLRLCLLRLLAEAPTRQANASILREAAEQFGLPASRDMVDAELVWLSELGLLKLVRPIPTLMVATLTARGADVAAGRAAVPGVKSRGPED